MSKINSVLNKYTKALKEIGIKKGREVSYRTPLENLLNDMLGIIKPEVDIKVLHEGRISEVIETKSRKIPDFIVYAESYGIKGLLGSVEAKDGYVNLDETVKSKQASEYSTFTPNLLITNYKEFKLTTLINDKVTVIKEVSLLDSNFNSLLSDTNIEDFLDLISAFYNSKVGYAVTKKDLATVLANLTKDLHKAIVNYCTNNSDAFCHKLEALYKEYSKIVSTNQDFSEFLESYSQSFIYGIIISKLGYEQEHKKIFILNDDGVSYLDDISDQFANDYKALYEFLDAGLDSRKVPKDLYNVFISIAKTFNLISFSELLANSKLDFSSLVVYLYEDYLKEYDTLAKKGNGVYYTPEPIVDFIVKATDSVLENNLNLEGGFRNKDVKVLDFATGTGSFLLSLYKHEFKKLGNSNKEKDKLTNKMINDYYGFELMFTPYIVAHTNLMYNLKQNKIDTDSALPIYLTNTLDLQQNSISDLLPELSHNYNSSQKVKQSDSIIAIIGNPPYNSKSINKGKEILALTDAYKKDLNEQTINSLSDDYVKFMRFAEHKIEKAGYGTVGIITNNSFLDGVTHRKMREHLLNTFDDIYIINLHGNSIIKESGLDGRQDKNVFDITVGTAISIFVKNKGNNTGKATVNYYSTLDNNLITKESKLNFLENNSLDTIEWTHLKPSDPYYFFLKKDFKKQNEYNEFWSLVSKNKQKKAIFHTFSIGVQTKYDRVAIHYSKKSLDNLRTDIKDLSVEEINKKYKLKKDSRGWNLSGAKEDLLKNYNPNKVMYKPFDIRYTSLSKISNMFLARPSYSIMKHFDNKENVGLLFPRNRVNKKFNHILITSSPPITAADYIAPLYLYPSSTEGELKLEEEHEKKANFTEEFNNFLSTLDFKPTPEEILYYIYAIMYNEQYRTDYIDFLEVDFAKVPITTNKRIFYEYSKLGEQLAKLHLMNNIPEDSSIDYVAYIDKSQEKLFKVLNDNFIIEQIKYNEEESTLTLISNNKSKIEITNISSDIWNYQVGNYQVIKKWLSYRKKDNVIITDADIHHIVNMAIILKNTISLQEQISNLDLPISNK